MRQKFTEKIEHKNYKKLVYGGKRLAMKGAESERSPNRNASMAKGGGGEERKSS